MQVCSIRIKGHKLCRLQLKTKGHFKNNFSTCKSMPRLLQNERERAVGMFQAGMRQTEIANHFICSRMTIYRLLVRIRATGTTSDRRRSGRPRETTLRQDISTSH